MNKFDFAIHLNNIFLIFQIVRKRGRANEAKAPFGLSYEELQPTAADGKRLASFSSFSFFSFSSPISFLSYFESDDMIVRDRIDGISEQDERLLWVLITIFFLLHHFTGVCSCLLMLLYVL